MAGEAVAVDLQLTNPLALPLECGFMRLIVEHWDPAVVSGPDAEGPSSPGTGWSPPPDDRVQVVEVDVSVPPHTIKDVTLTVTPHAPGMLTIKGVTWLLQGVVKGYILFDATQHNKRIVGRRPRGGGKSNAMYE